MAWWDNNLAQRRFRELDAGEVLPKLSIRNGQTWLNGSGFKQAAMSEDARRTTHPIQQPIANESAALAAFDFNNLCEGTGDHSHGGKLSRR